MIHDWQTSSPGPSSADANPTAYPRGKWNCPCPHKLSDLATLSRRSFPFRMDVPTEAGTFWMPETSKGIRDITLGIGPLKKGWSGYLAGKNSTQGGDR